MKTALLHQFYQLLGLEKVPQSNDEIDKYVDGLQSSVWNQHNKYMVKIAFQHVRRVLLFQKYIQSHSDDTFTCYTIPLQAWDLKKKQWHRIESWKTLQGKDILKFFDENQRYRKRYWSNEERLKRVIQNGDDQ